MLNTFACDLAAAHRKRRSARAVVVGRQHHSRLQKANKVLRRRRMLALLAEVAGCIDCGATERLEFDHRDPATKCFKISDGGSLRRSLRSLFAEIAKCDVRCVACHRARHRTVAFASRSLAA